MVFNRCADVQKIINVSYFMRTISSLCKSNMDTNIDIAI